MHIVQLPAIQRDDAVTPTDPNAIVSRVTRFVAAAGRDPWLVGYDANGIQELIAASGRPISMRGASEAILDFDKEVREGELAIFAGGGRGVVLARSQEDALLRARALVNRYRTITHGGVMATCAVPLDRGGAAEAQSIRWLRHRLEIAKDAALPPAGELPDAKDRECAYCRMYRGTRPCEREQQIELVCTRCNAMLEQGRSAGRRRGRRRGEMSLSIADIATDGWIAVISADGNNLGALFESLGTLVELAVVSEAVAASFENAQERALAGIPEDKRVPLLTGGDDVRAFIPPGYVLRYVSTLVESVEAAAADHARAAHSLISREIAASLDRLGVGVGAVIANVYYPAWRLVDYAHELERSAKAACREHKWRSGFDFAVVTAEDAMTSGSAGTLDARNNRPLPPCSRTWRDKLDAARALAGIPPAQIAMVFSAPMDEAELGNLLCYQVARSKEWRAWYAACDVDWRDRTAVLKHRPTRDMLELARLRAFEEISR